MTVVLCDDHAMFLEALQWALEARGQKVLATVDDPAEVLAVVQRERPEVCVLDVSFRTSSGLEAAAMLREAVPDIPIMLLTGSGEGDVWAALDSGLVDGVVNKTCPIEVIDAAIARVAAGESVVEGLRRTVPRRQSAPMDLLTQREREVLDMIVDGLDTGGMAGSLGVSENTVRTHVQGVLGKLGVHRRTKAVQIALAHRDLTSGTDPKHYASA